MTNKQSREEATYHSAVKEYRLKANLIGWKSGLEEGKFYAFKDRQKIHTILLRMSSTNCKLWSNHNLDYVFLHTDACYHAEVFEVFLDLINKDKS